MLDLKYVLIYTRKQWHEYLKNAVGGIYCYFIWRYTTSSLELKH